MAAEHPDLLLQVDFDEVSRDGHSIVERYERAEIDSVYIVYNEFKSVHLAARGGGEAAADPQAGLA